MATLQSLAFGELLRRYRLSAGLTQEALAERAGLSARAISDLERGIKRAPRKDTVQLLLRALQLEDQERALFEAAVHRWGDRAIESVTKRRSGYTSVPPLAGRNDELDALDHHLAGNGPPVLLLAGEPGIGKTCLLQEAARRARDRGWQVLRGTGQRYSPPDSHTPLVEALEHHIRRLSPAQRRATLQGCSWLARLIPDVVEPGAVEPPAYPLSPRQERRLIFDAVARFLAAIAGPAGTLLVLDDVQWAGRDALDLLFGLARISADPASSGDISPDARPLSLRVIAAYRTTDLDGEDVLGPALGALAQARLVTQRTLGPLTPQESRYLIQSMVTVSEGSRYVEEIYGALVRRSGGVPFVLLSFAEALRAPPSNNGQPASLPWDLVQSIRQRVAVLPVTAQRLLALAAVMGHAIPYALLFAAAACPEDEALDALAVLCRARLLIEDKEGLYRFAYEAIQDVVADGLGAARRATLHRRIAETLEHNPHLLLLLPTSNEADTGYGQGRRSGWLAFHYIQAGVREKAAFYLEQAADAANARHANQAAEEDYRRLLDLLDTDRQRLDRVRVGTKLGRLLLTEARYDEALDVLEKAALDVQAGYDPDSLGAILAVIGRVHAARGTPHDGIMRLQRFLPALEGQAEVSPALAALYAALAHLSGAAGHYDEQLKMATQAENLARRLGDDAVAADALERRGLGLVKLGHVDEGLKVLDEAIALAERAGAGDSLISALTDAAFVARTRGQFDRDRSYIERALTIARRAGDPAQLARLLSHYGITGLVTGDWDRARAACEEAVAISRQTGTSQAYAHALLWLGHHLLHRGEWEEATQMLDEAAALARHSGDLYVLRWSQSLLAEHDILRGDAAAARDRLLPLLDRPGAVEQDVTTALLPRLAWAYMELGEQDQAKDMIEQAIQRARSDNNRVGLIVSLWIQAMIEMRQGLWDHAARTSKEALSLAQSIPFPFAEARILTVYGQMHIQRGEMQAARKRLEAALTIFRRLGARKDAERAGDALAVLSARNPSVPARLTITATQWERIQALLPARRRAGRPRVDDRRILEGVLYVLRTGCAWADLPAEYGNDATVHRRWQRWQADGTWQQILQILDDPGQ